MEKWAYFTTHEAHVISLMIGGASSKNNRKNTTKGFSLKY